MKKLLFLFISLIVLISCETSTNNDNTKKSKESAKTSENVSGSENPNGYGQVVTLEKAADARRLPMLMESVNEKKIKIIGEVTEVCQMSGCWLDIDIGNDQIVHVTFKDEAFVVPVDLAGTIILTEGIVTKELLPVDMLKKMAEDEGKSQNDIDEIKSPITEYYLEAIGINLK